MEIPEALLGRRAALTGLWLAVAIVVLAIGVPAIATAMALQQETDATLTQLARYRAEVGERPKLEEALRTLRQRAVGEPGLIVAADSSLAEAQLQGEIKRIVEFNAGEVRSAQVATKKTVGELEEITVQYDLVIPITKLSAVLYAIESHTPYLIIDQATISAPLGWQPQAAMGPKRAAEPVLQVRCAIRAYRWSAT